MVGCVCAMRATRQYLYFSLSCFFVRSVLWYVDSNVFMFAIVIVGVRSLVPHQNMTSLYVHCFDQNRKSQVAAVDDEKGGNETVARRVIKLSLVIETHIRL